MKRFLVLAIFLFTGACALQAQVVDTTVCDVLKNPASFNGKIVRIKGTVSAGFDQFIVRGPDCGQQVDGIWLAYPEGTKGKAAPDAMLEILPAHNFAGKVTPPTRASVTLQKDKEFKKFDSLLSEEHKGPYMCLGCRRYEVSATLVGRLDGVADATLERDPSGKISGFGGFGNMNAYPARLVLQSVSDVTPKEIDYSNADTLAKGNIPTLVPQGGLYDPLATAHTAAAAIGSSPAGVQAQKDIEVFPKKGEHNGVTIEYGRMNEVAANDGAPGASDSPDGVLFICTFNMNHLQGLDLPAAMLHISQHVEELRNPEPNDVGVPPMILEANAWAVTISAAMGMREKFLVLPGANIAWNWKWPQSDISSNFASAMKTFLADQALLSQ